MKVKIRTIKVGERLEIKAINGYFYKSYRDHLRENMYEFFFFIKYDILLK